MVVDRTFSESKGEKKNNCLFENRREIRFVKEGGMLDDSR